LRIGGACILRGELLSLEDSGEKKLAAVEIYGVSRNFRDKFCYLCNQSANKSEEEIKEIKLIEESNYRVTSIITVWLLKYSVVNFADFGAF